MKNAKRTLGIVLVVSIPWGSVTPAQTASEILEATGVQGGLIVHLGCGEGQLTAALRVNARYSVHGLDTDPSRVEKAREHIKNFARFYGRVAVDSFDGQKLPYVDNSVNLVVTENLGQVTMEEVLRVLCPLGVAYVKTETEWQKTVKPWPAELDEWTHYLHGPSGNAVSNDSVVGPPRRLQWTGGPRWSRHHDHMASVSAMVSAGGRLFYIMDEGSRWSILSPAKWALFARDAFNGTMLWKRQIDSWHTHLWPLKSGPAQMPHRLVAEGDTVYATLGLATAVSALDAATGETIRTYSETLATEELIVSEGVIFALVNEFPMTGACTNNIPTSAKEIRRTSSWPCDERERKIVAVRADTGQFLWQTQHVVMPCTLTADSRRVVFHNGERVVCLNRQGGNRLWQSEAVARRNPILSYFTPRLVLYGDVVFFSGGAGTTNDTMTALSAVSGETLWNGSHPQSGYRSPEDLVVVDDKVWCPETTYGNLSGEIIGYDALTGTVESEFGPDVDTHWFHHRCYSSRATGRYLLTSRTGIEFVDLRSKHWEPHHWVRGGCLYGELLGNGLLYVPPTSCGCYILAKLYGFNALAPAASRPLGEVPPETRLLRGPAYGAVQPDRDPPAAGDWPTYRHDAARSGHTETAISEAELFKAWETPLGGRLSSLVIAGDRLYVASIDEHTVHAIDAGSGALLWSFTAGGRVDSPPTVYQGHVVFGSFDGGVYCLRATDGELSWRFRAAPHDRRLMSYRQIESVWPVHGSVLVQEDPAAERPVVCCVSGRSMFLDGGLRMIRLDLSTGALLSEQVLDDRDPATNENLQVTISGLNMPTALPDVLSSDGERVYMRAQEFDLGGNRLALVTPTDAYDQTGPGAHLFGSTGFLDGDWFHRAYWIYGKTFMSGASGYYTAGLNAPAGRILSFDDSHVYGFGRKPRYYQWTTPLEYHLFSTSKYDFQDERPPATASRPSITVQKSPSLDPTNKPVTVEAWAQATERSGAVVARGGASHGYAIFVQAGKPNFAMRSAGQLGIVAGSEDVVGRWVHLAGVLTRDLQLELYVNGQLAGTRPAPGLIVQDPNNLLDIAADFNSAVGEYNTPFAFTGSIDEVRIYHRALSAGEIEAHHAQPASVPAQGPDLVLYFSFEGGTAEDHSGNGNDGVVTQGNRVSGKVGDALSFSGTSVRPPSRSVVKYLWSRDVPFFARAMVLAQTTLFIAGPPDFTDEEAVFVHPDYSQNVPHLKEQAASFEGKRGALLWAVSTADGSKLAEYDLDAAPVWDGMASAGGKLYMATVDGSVVCLSSTKFLRGDANADGGVDISDAIYILRYLFAQRLSILCPDTADTNDDGTINISDSVYLLSYLFMSGGAGVAPLDPNCVVDGPDLGECLYPREYCGMR